MLGLPLAFAYPWVLLGLLSLPVIWYLLRLTPPKPQTEVFPPLVILEKLGSVDETPAKSPWWLTLLRLMLAGLLILAMAGPVWNPRDSILKADGPVLMVIDDGWASGEQWEEMKSTALEAVREVAADNRIVALVQTSNPAATADGPRSPDEIEAVLEAAENRPLEPDHEGAASQIRQAIAATDFDEVLFFSDGLDRNARSDDLAAALDAAGAPVSVFTPDLSKLTILGPVENQPGKMTGNALRAQSGDGLPLRITGLDENGLAVARANIIIPSGEKSADFEFNQPVELRNQITRVTIENTANAGAVQLLDESNRRRIVGLVSGQSADIAQPLLSPLYYINRALAPFSDLRIADTANLDFAIDEMIDQKVSAIIMADVGTLSPETREKVSDFVEDGGLLVRFAGPRLAANPESPLLPVELVQGNRFIGGALSWETPKEIAAFEPGSPFFGFSKPTDVTVTRQVLAIQSRSLEERTWARLEDGTPLVTAGRQGAGWIVLFHVNSDNNWSNLPLSGSFVEMLRRTVSLSRATGARDNTAEPLPLPALEVLNGKGNLMPPSSEVRPLVLEATISPVPTLENPPGRYGTSDGYVALNLIGVGDSLEPLETGRFSGADFSGYLSGGSTEFKPLLLATAALLFLADCLAVLWFAGVLQGRWIRTTAAATNTGLAMILVAALAFTTAPPATAQSSDTATAGVDYSAALDTRFAYVKTGISEIDRISEAGLLGLTRYVASRTALEPGPPAGIDIETDELSFYPFLYWPVDDNAPVPDDRTMARIDAYMKQGGSVLFDTRDQLSNMLNSGGNLKLRAILDSLDIPPLEPVPPDHVLTKSFYLLDGFPGRYQGGELWVEQIATIDESANRPARAGDGVSTILITSNDFAGAWAIGDNDRSMFPTVPPNPAQREFAFRAGVNIVMYAITGNYKADQVHIPALLERLGQ